jgi:uncharacterized OB-fold protein
MKFEDEDDLFWSCDECGTTHYEEVTECEDCFSTEVYEGARFKSAFEIINSLELAERMGVLPQ